MKQRYHVVAPKFNYYLGLLVAIGFVIFFVLAFEMVVRKNLDSNAILIVYLITSPYSLFLLYVNSSKNIYAIIDREKETFLYGNVFLHQEVDLKAVRIIKRRLLNRSTYIVAINNKRYFMTSKPEDLKILEASYNQATPESRTT